MQKTLPQLPKRQLPKRSNFFISTHRIQKQAFLFENAAEDTPLYLAGLYTQDTDGQERFVILTREANDAVSPVHPRMPCLLPNVEYCHAWLHADALAKDLLTMPVQVQLKCTNPEKSDL